MRTLILIFCLSVLYGCGEDTPPNPPAVTVLVFPSQNLDCTQGQLVNEVTRSISFEWRLANDAETYQLEIIKLSSGQKTTQTTTLNTIAVPLEMGEAYSWRVIASNTKVVETTSSALWYFYNAGAETSRAPFPATAIAPLPGSILSMPENATISISWSGLDLDNDISTYTLHLDTQNPPQAVQNLSSPLSTQFSVTVAQGQTYYWQVLTLDKEGNETPSQVFDFKIQ